MDEGEVEAMGLGFWFPKWGWDQGLRFFWVLNGTWVWGLNAWVQGLSGWVLNGIWVQGLNGMGFERNMGLGFEWNGFRVCKWLWVSGL